MNSLQSHPFPLLATRILAAIALSLAAPLASHAASLAWTSDSQHFETGFDDESVTATYAFTNTGETPVTIVESKASCGCTVPSLDKETYQPGETGELTAIFTIGSRQGKQRKVITIATKDAAGTEATYELKLEVDIPVPVAFKPRVRFWKLNDAAETQEIEVTFNEKMPMSITDLARKDPSEPAAFDYQVETVTEGLAYKIKLTPKTPNEKSRDVFYILSDQDEKNILKKFPIYAYVR